MRNNRHHSARAILVSGKLLQVRKPHIGVVQMTGGRVKNQQVRRTRLRQSRHQLNVHLTVKLIHPQVVQVLKTAFLQPAARTGTTKNRQIIGEHLRHVVVHTHVLLGGGHVRRVDNVTDTTQLLHRNRLRLTIPGAPENPATRQGQTAGKSQTQRGALHLAIRLNNDDLTLIYRKRGTTKKGVVTPLSPNIVNAKHE
ncbi:Uncharacterised protein [Mycobacterium tuberculosis]|nr:Uncharacterised protein [Mycobacterium tuberculosis]